MYVASDGGKKSYLILWQRRPQPGFVAVGGLRSVGRGVFFFSRVVADVCASPYWWNVDVVRDEEVTKRSCRGDLGYVTTHGCYAGADVGCVEKTPPVSPFDRWALRRWDETGAGGGGRLVRRGGKQRVLGLAGRLPARGGG